MCFEGGFFCTLQAAISLQFYLCSPPPPPLIATRLSGDVKEHHLFIGIPTKVRHLSAANLSHE